MLDLTVVIPTCNRAAMLRDAIVAVRDGTDCSYQVIVVDGASTDSTGDVLADLSREMGDRLRVIREPRREGFTKAVNRGFRAATGNYVTWLNDDARPVTGSYDNAIDQLEAAPARVGLVAMFHQCSSEKNVAYETVRDGHAFQLMHVRGTLYANFGIGRRAMFERLGFFDERYYLYGADPDFSLTVWNAGKTVVPAVNALIEHDEFVDDRREADTARGQADNAKLFAKWNLPPKNLRINDFDPMRPCTVHGLVGTAGWVGVAA